MFRPVQRALQPVLIYYLPFLYPSVEAPIHRIEDQLYPFLRYSLRKLKDLNDV